MGYKTLLFAYWDFITNSVLFLMLMIVDCALCDFEGWKVRKGGSFGGRWVVWSGGDGGDGGDEVE